MTINPQRVQALFLATLEISDSEARRELLERECNGDAALRQRVEDLLAAHDAIGGFDAAPSIPVINATINAPADPQPGSLVAGRYKLLEKVGEGGMGAVWVAEQSVPVKRKVALKLIKAGMDSKAVLARFDAERQALALMDHPNIAKVLDAGTAESGRPYFVMELVKGTPITEFCDTRKLDPRQRLELFVPVCQAIQHAHQKGIIHRDIKPSNVLVAMYDDRPVPKVIDFGVAKATGQSLTDQSVYTGFGAVVGTPEYMSPEQASINNLDIDTRSDVYSLGVLLYELLTGTTPVDRKSLGKAALLEILRIVREVEAPRPSAKLSSSDTLPSVAANRGSEPAKLSKLMKGELDWVLLKALEKDRTRRYDTANGLARDIQRYLDDEVIEARPPSAGYRLQKLIRRHKGQVIAASLLLFALLAGIAGTTLGLFEARRQEQRALAAAEEERKAKLEAEDEKANALKAAEAEMLAKLDADAKRQDAERNLAFAKKGNEILGSVFAGLDPRMIAESGRPLQDVLRENLVTAVKELNGTAIGDPLELAAMQNTLGTSLLGLGESEMAIEVFAKALDSHRASLCAEHPATLISMDNLATAYLAAGKTDLALPLFEETSTLMKAKLGAEHPDTLNNIGNLASAYQEAGKLDQALPLLEETLKLRKAKLGPDHPKTLISMGNLATAYLAARKPDLALPLFEETIKLQKAKLGLEHPDTLASMGNLATAYCDTGRLQLALPLLEETLKLRKAKLGPDHPHTLRNMSSLAWAYQHTGKLVLALPLLEETLKIQKAKLSPQHPYTLATMGSLASAYEAAGKLEMALPLYEETLSLMEAKLGPDSPDTLATMNNLALAYETAGKLDLSLPLLEETLKRQKDKLGTEHPDTLATMNNFAMVYKAARKLDLALPLFEETLKLMKAQLGPAHPRTLDTMCNLGVAYCDAKQFAKATPLLTEYVAAKREQSKPDDPGFAGLLARVSVDLLKCDQFATAEELLRECLAIREKTQADAWTTFNTKSMLGGALLRQKKYAEAEPFLLKGYEGMKARAEFIPPQGSTRIAKALEHLVELFTNLNTAEPNKGYDAKATEWQKKLDEQTAASKNKLPQ